MASFPPFVMTETISIRHARLQDAAALSALASRTFKDTFGPHTVLNDIVVYLASAYSPEQQAAERVGEHVFPVGSDPQVDWLITRPLDASSGTPRKVL